MKKIYNTIGLAYRSRNIVLGTDNIIEESRRGKINLIIISKFASINTQKLIQDKLSDLQIPIIFLDEKPEYNLSKSIGKNDIKVIGIKSSGFSKKIAVQIKGE